MTMPPRWRTWRRCFGPNGPTCPHCGATDRIYALKGKSTRPGRAQVRPLPEAVHGHGRHPLRAQPRPAAQVAAGHLPSQLLARRASAPTSFIACSTSPIKTAWFISHRIREAMRDGALAPLGGEGKIVEADETYIGRKEGWKPQRGGEHKMKVLSSGRARRQGPLRPHGRNHGRGRERRSCARTSPARAA